MDVSMRRVMIQSIVCVLLVTNGLLAAPRQIATYKHPTNDATESIQMLSEQCEERFGYFWHPIMASCTPCSAVCLPSAENPSCRSNCPSWCPDDSFFHTPMKTCTDCGPLCRRDQPLPDVLREFCLINCPDRTCEPQYFFHPMLGECVACSRVCGPTDDPLFCLKQCGGPLAAAVLEPSGSGREQPNKRHTVSNPDLWGPNRFVTQDGKVVKEKGEGTSGNWLAIFLCVLFAASVLCVVGLLLISRFTRIAPANDRKVNQRGEGEHLNDQQDPENIRVDGKCYTENGEEVLTESDAPQRYAGRRASLNDSLLDNQDRHEVGAGSPFGATDGGQETTCEAEKYDLKLRSGPSGSEVNLAYTERSRATVSTLQDETDRKLLDSAVDDRLY